MSLITTTFVKTKFPQWKDYCGIQETILQSCIDNAEAEISFYLNITASTITPFINLLLLYIVKKQCFDLLHGDKEFEHKPQILKDYEKTIATLQAIKDGALSLTGTSVTERGSIAITSDKKLFDFWFSSKSLDLSQMEEQHE